MKNISLLLSILLFWVIVNNTNSFAQSGSNTISTCATNILNTTPFETVAASCTSTSIDWMNHYRLQTHYIPLNGFEAIKTIPINLVIFRDGNITPLPEALMNLNRQTYQDWINWSFTFTENPTCPPMNPAYLPDSKIRFVIANIYYYDNSLIYNYPTSAVDAKAIKHHIDLVPAAAKQFNCYLIKNFYVANAAGHASLSTYGGNAMPYVLSGANYTYTGPWQADWFYFEEHLPHELGHLLGLKHTYESETLNQNNLDFLDDVFANPPAYYPASACNNMLGGNTLDHRFISPKQMGRMHRTLSTNIFSLVGDVSRHFAYGYSATPHNINSNETWDFTFKSYNDIVVKSGATLTLKCRLEMVPSSKIIVESGGQLVIDGATIVGARCGGPDYEGLWAGIDAQFNSAVVTKNAALIEDAQYGIKTNNGASIFLENTTFNKCYVGVYVPATTSGNNLINGHIRGCTFKCDGILKPAYPGQGLIDNQIPPSNWGSYAGIRMDNVTFLIDGGASRNNFIGDLVTHQGTSAYRLNAGIVGKNSNFTVKNCMFKNIIDYGNYDNQSAGIYVLGLNGYYTLDQTGLGNLSSNPKTFENCTNSIMAHVMNVNAHHNFMDITSRGVAVTYCANRNVSIHHNLIYSDWHGIESTFNDATTSLEISDNKIHVGEYFNSPYNTLHSDGVGIWLSEYAISNINSGLYGNYVYVDKALDGIRIENVKNATIAFNHVQLNNSIYNRYGIVLKGCDGINVNCSDVTGNSIATTDQQRAVYLASTTNSNISCIDVDGTFNGIHVDGICANTFLSKNSFHNHNNGLKIGATGVLPDHINRGNKWQSTSGIIDAINNGNPFYSKFYVNPYSSPYKPSNFAPSTFFSQGTGSLPPSCLSSTCLSQSIPLSSEEELAIEEAIARGDLQTPIYTLPMDFEARRYLYDRLSEDNALLQSDPEFQNFYSGEVQGNTDELRQVNEANETVYNMTANLAAQLEQNKLSIEQNLNQIGVNNDLIQTGNLSITDISNLKTANQTLAASNQNLQTFNDAAIETLNDNRILNADNIRITNSGIITNVNYELNEKTVNDIYLATIAQQNYNFTAVQEVSLLAIALQCPFAGGTAVYKARALNAIINPNQEYNDNLICLNEGVVLRKAGENEGSITDENIVVSYAYLVPNPATSFVTLNYSLGKDISGTLQISNMLGIKIKDIVLPPNQNSIGVNITEIPSGVYYYNVLTINGNLSMGKVIITH